MSYTKRLRLLIIVTVCMLSSLAPAKVSIPAQSKDEAALRAIVSQFFDAFAKEDLNSIIQLWSLRSPNLKSHREVMEYLFAVHDRIEVKGLTIGKLTVEADRASARVAVEISAADAKTGKQSSSFGKLSRTFGFVKEDNAWKIWRETSTQIVLAAALIGAKSEEERAALLASEKELITVGLREALLSYGSALSSQGNYPQALIAYRTGLKVAEQIKDQEGVAEALNRMGIAHKDQGNYSEALQHLEKSLEISEAADDKKRIADVLNNLANVHGNQSKFDKAIEYYKRSLALREGSGDEASIGAALNNIGLVYQDKGDLSMALEYLKKGLKLREEADDEEGIAGSLNNIGNVEFAQGNFSSAAEYYKKALEQFQALGDRPRMATVLSNIGSVYRQQGDYPQAFKHLLDSLALQEEMKNKKGLALTLGDIGLVHQDQGNYEQALEAFQKVLRLREEMGDKQGIADALINIGSLHSSRGNYGLSLEYSLKGLAISQSLGDKSEVIGAMSHIGIVHGLQGNHNLALEYFQKALALSESAGFKVGVAQSLANAGISYKNQGNYDLAVEHYQKSLKQFEAMQLKSGVADLLYSLGEVHFKQSKHTQALEYFQKAFSLYEEMGTKQEIARTLAITALVHNSQGNHQQSVELAGRSSAIATQIGDRETLWEARTAAGRAYRALNQSAQARQSFEEAIATIETLRALAAGGEREKQRFFEDKVVAYQAIVELLIAQNNASEALQYAERAKARVLLDILYSGKVSITKAMTGEEREQERKLKSEMVSLNTQIYRESNRPQPDQTRLADLNARLQKARLEHDAFQINLYAAHPGLGAQRGQAQPLKPEEASELLPDAHSALIEYVVADEKTYLFMLARSARTNQAGIDLKVYQVEIKQKELADRVERFRRQLATRDVSFRQSAKELYDLLVGPAQAQLQGKTNLIIVPDGALWELPFQALQSRDNRYLLEASALSYAPSLTVLREMAKLRKQEPGSASLLAIGNPALSAAATGRANLARSGNNLHPLPEAEKEARTLRELYGPGQSSVYIGAEASEERLKAEAGKFTILHFATHGMLDDANPMYSHVVLSQAEGGKGEDGLLEAWEIMQLDLKADLAVLSACETARGRVGAGEGMIGLSWALFVAGCPTAVVSQWKVDSASTTRLMLEFHRNLKARTRNSSAAVTKANALRQAALKLMRSPQYRHPFYWAGFVVIGDGL